MSVGEGVVTAANVVPLPGWVERSLRLREGRDPLGLQTMTQDRFMPRLLPGILELTRRARYFSFHAFLLSEYQRERAKADNKVLSAFIKRAEWDFGLAVLRCRRCSSSPVGARRLAGLDNGSGPFPRGESVESSLGGYGLYYRSPMIAIGVVAGAGSLLGDEPIPIDLLYETQRARDLADTFRAAVAETAYYRDRYLWTTQPVPADVVDEYAAVACLCQLRERLKERDAVHAALFDSDTADASYTTGTPGDDEVVSDATGTEGALIGSTLRRCRSVAHYLTLVDSRPGVVDSESAYRDALWSPPPVRSTEHAVIAGEWSALAAKDVWQEALCSIWTEFCRTGLARTRELDRGLTWQEAHDLVALLVDGPPTFDVAAHTADIASAITAGAMSLPANGETIVVSQCTLEQLRRGTRELDTAASGVVVLLELARRMENRSGTGWVTGCQVASVWQPSLAMVMGELDGHLRSQPSIADTLWWVLSRFVVPVHERIAYSKLPEFTFRFRWEDGLLRFYDLGVERFPLAGIRDEPLSLLTHDLGFWDAISGDAAALTDRGWVFVEEMLG